jgi:hypothetical protein
MQDYSRITRLEKAGLVKRQKGRYFLTAFGMAINDTQILLGNVKNYWKLKTIDSLGVANIYMPKEERNKTIQRMISNQQIKEILLSTKAWLQQAFHLRYFSFILL